MLEPVGGWHLGNGPRPDERKRGGDQMRDEVFETTAACGTGLDTPAGRAWVAFLRSHAGVTRIMDAELRREVGLPLADFDVLIQLAMEAPACLRMTELARRTLLSKSGTTRRVEQLEREGLVARKAAGTDRRSVVVSLEPAGVEALRRALPVHARGIAMHFAAKITDEDADALRQALEKVSPEPAPG